MAVPEIAAERERGRSTCNAYRIDSLKAAALNSPTFFFQIRAKVNQDPIETEPGACATFESEQVSFDFHSYVYNRRRPGNLAGAKLPAPFLPLTL